MLPIVAKINRLKKIKAEREQRINAISQAPAVPTDWALFAPMVNIRSGGSVIPFQPYDFQIDLIRQIEANPNTVICKSRQMGISETLCSWFLMRALTEPGFSGVVFSKTQKDSSDLGGRIRDMAVSLGSLCPELETESKLALAFKGLGRIVFLPVTARAARGIPSVSALLFDEAAFIDGIEGVYQAAVPTLAMLGDKGRVILNSTPNGKLGLFYEAWTDQGDSWHKVKLHYSQHPVYNADPDWAQKTRENRKLTDQQWEQEFELNFAESDVQVFSADLLDGASIGEWTEPIEGRKYLAGLSPTFSTDHFVLQIWDVDQTPYQMVYEYRERGGTVEDHISKACEIINWYKPSTVAIRSEGGRVIAAETLAQRHPEWNIKLFPATTANRITLTDRLSLLLQQQNIIFPADSALSSEAKNYRDTDGTRNPSPGFEDGSLIAAAVALAEVNAIAGRRPFDPFNRQKNCIGLSSGLGYDPLQDIYVSFDFNNSPATAIAAQRHKDALVIVREFRLKNSNTFELAEAVCDWLKREGQQGKIHIHGDASGKNKTPNSRHTNWKIVWDELAKQGLKDKAIRRYPNKNPSVYDSTQAVNNLFIVERLYILASECPWLILDLEQTKWDKNGTEFDKSNPALTHHVDELRYLVWDLFGFVGQAERPKNRQQKPSGFAA